MPDREKVLKGLECCLVSEEYYQCDKCPYRATEDERKVIDWRCHLEELRKDALELLKAQEPVKPILKRKAPNAMYNDYVCPICNQEIVYEQKCCCEYGRVVKWNG